MTPQLRGSHLHQLKAKALEIFGSISQTFSMNIKSIGKYAVPTEVASKAISQHLIVLFFGLGHRYMFVQTCLYVPLFALISQRNDCAILWCRAIKGHVRVVVGRKMPGF